MQDNEQVLKDTLNLLMEQWNIANALKDESKRLRHTAKLALWISQVEALLEAETQVIKEKQAM